MNPNADLGRLLFLALGIGETTLDPFDVSDITESPSTQPARPDRSFRLRWSEFVRADDGSVTREAHAAIVTVLSVEP